MRGFSFVAFVTALAPFAASAQPVFDGVEKAEIEACRDDAQWVHKAAVYAYFKDSYYDLDKHFLAFTGTAAQRVEAATAMTDEAKRLETYTFLHEQMKDLIPRMGRLLPRMERPLDLKPMIRQMLESDIWDPQGDHHTEYLRVALAREMLAVPAPTARDLGPRIAAFLTYFSVVEELLLTLKTGGGDEKDVAALKANLAALNLGWRDGFRPIANHAIFGNYASSLDGRLAFKVKEICNTRLTCSSDSLDAPMDCGE
ncbi:hypothetical protein [Hyphococcus sp.]|uniref:hypothetical protein n=1 Tax=Hyphococcus sp. TaxID=2038636 RepID=UPI003D0AF888